MLPEKSSQRHTIFSFTTARFRPGCVYSAADPPLSTPIPVVKLDRPTLTFDVLN
jgi:hypothetical protein